MAYVLCVLRRFCRVLYFRLTNNEGFLNAAALAYSSALSVVPLLAVMFGVAKGFGIERIIEESLRSEFHEQPQAIEYLIRFGNTLLEQARGGLIAGVGVITLLFTVMRLFASIEGALNRMWGLVEARPWWRKIGDYLALILICPILFATSSSLTVYITSHLEIIRVEYIPVAPVLAVLIQLVPYLMSTILFTFLYMVMPYATVRVLPALFSGLCAGSCYQVLQATYITLQIQLTRVNAIYGSLAALPLFLAWLYCSWLIFLIGAELLVIVQERLWDPHGVPAYRTPSPREHTLLLLALSKAVVDARIADHPMSEEGLTRAFTLPKQLARTCVNELSSAGVLLKTTNGDSLPLLFPGHSAGTPRVMDVLRALHEMSPQTPPLWEGTSLAKAVRPFEKIIDDMDHQLATSPYNLPLRYVDPPGSRK